MHYIYVCTSPSSPNEGYMHYIYVQMPKKIFFSLVGTKFFPLDLSMRIFQATIFHPKSWKCNLFHVRWWQQKTASKHQKKCWIRLAAILSLYRVQTAPSIRKLRNTDAQTIYCNPNHFPTPRSQSIEQTNHDFILDINFFCAKSQSWK